MCYELSPEVFLSFAAIFSVDLRIAKQNIHIKRISVFVEKKHFLDNPISVVNQRREETLADDVTNIQDQKWLIGHVIIASSTILRMLFPDIKTKSRDKKTRLLLFNKGF